MTPFHLTQAVVGRRALARDEAERRTLVRSLVRAGRGQLFAFDLVDDHAHMGVLSPRPRMIARDIRRALIKHRPDLRLEAPHLKPVDTCKYLRWLVTYLLQQPVKHKLRVHPALWTGSCFQDLVGARLLPGFSPALLFAELPRLTLGELLTDVGLPAISLEPASDEALRRAGAARLADLAAGVHAANPALAGRHRPTVLARSLAAALGVRLGFSRAHLAPFLNATPQTVGRLAQRPTHPKAEQALRLRFTLEERVRAQPRASA